MKSFIKIIAITVLVGMATAKVVPKPYHTDDFLHYYTLHEIEHYMEHLVEDYPDFVSVEKVGSTSEGRDINAMLIGKRETEINKPIIMVESGLHAREWIATMVNLYFIHMFTEHSEHKHLLERVNLLIVPMANPDGYVYSHESDRNWNKNRRTVSEQCIGVDLLRNFDFDYKPSSQNNCDEHFSGSEAASEAEVQSIQKLIEKYQSQIKIYLSLQAFGTQILTPYNSKNAQYENQEQLLKLGKTIAAAIQVINKTKYRVGQGAQLLKKPEYGTSSDYAFGVGKIPAAFTVKLPGKNYEVPENQLDGILSESWAGFLKLVELFSNKLGEPTPYDI